jgi:hypothetical protein
MEENIFWSLGCTYFVTVLASADREMVGWLMNNELESIWKETLMT